MFLLKGGWGLDSSPKLARSLEEEDVDGKVMVSVARVALEAFMIASENGASKFSMKRGLRSEVVDVDESWKSGCSFSGRGSVKFGFREAILASRC